MEDSVTNVMDNYVQGLGALLDDPDPKVRREAVSMLHIFDIMMHAMQTLDGLYTGQRVPGWHGMEDDRPREGMQVPLKLCNCGLSEKIDEAEDSEYFGKKICNGACMQSAIESQGDVAEYIKFLSEESDETQTEDDLNSAVEDISSFVDDQLGIKRIGKTMIDPPLPAGKMPVSLLQDGQDFIGKIEQVDNMESLIEKRKLEREEDLKREREKIKAAKNNPVRMEFSDSDTTENLSDSTRLDEQKEEG